MPSMREMRLSRALSQRDLAAKAGVSAKTIVDLEQGRFEPRLRTIRLIAEALGVDSLEIEEFQKAIAAKVAA
jgi:transcriptional regulator with XRE-family HTH domain